MQAGRLHHKIRRAAEWRSVIELWATRVRSSKILILNQLDRFAHNGA
jgi:hypothetical protein